MRKTENGNLKKGGKSGKRKAENGNFFSVIKIQNRDIVVAK
jgi:hypothetical protein